MSNGLNLMQAFLCPAPVVTTTPPPTTTAPPTTTSAPVTRTPTVFDAAFNTGITLSESDRRASSQNTSTGLIRSVFSVTSGKWYFEFVNLTFLGQGIIGVGSPSVKGSTYAGNAGTNCVTAWYATNDIYSEGVVVGATGYANNSPTFYPIGVILDADARTVKFVTGVGTTAAFAIPGSGAIYAVFSNFGGSVSEARLNAGQSAFTYTPPSGYETVFGPPVATTPPPTTTAPPGTYNGSALNLVTPLPVTSALNLTSHM